MTAEICYGGRMYSGIQKMVSTYFLLKKNKYLLKFFNEAL